MIDPAGDHPHNTRPRWQYWIGVCLAKVLGWDFVESMPRDPKMIVLSGPHTTMWDGVILLCAILIYRAEIKVMARGSLFRFPIGGFLRFMGGMPIDRSSSHNVVDQMVQRFAEHERLLLIIPAAGTRSKRDHWKSGFYHIAKKAGVPLCFSYMDYANKRAGFRGTLHTTGNMKADMDKIRDVYADIPGKNPQNRSDIRLRDETRPQEQ